jgi:hypothetical protein
MTMTTDPATPADSTPGRGFGLARFVLRAVAGAVLATRKAATRVLRKVEAKGSADVSGREAPAAPVKRPRTPVLLDLQRLLALPADVHRQIAAILHKGGREMQGRLTPSRAMRRRYLDHAANPATYYDWELAHREENAAGVKAERDELWGRILEDDAFDRHRPVVLEPTPTRDDGGRRPIGIVDHRAARRRPPAHAWPFAHAQPSPAPLAAT